MASIPPSKTTDTGTNAPVVTTQNSQSTPSNSQVDLSQGEPQFPQSSSTPLPGKAPTQPGASAKPEDSGRPTPTHNETIINAAGNNPIIPQPNVLDQYASYTYSLSLYLITNEQLKTLQNTTKVDTNNWSLLIQSGGASTQTTSVNPTTSTTGAPAYNGAPVVGGGLTTAQAAGTTTAQSYTSGRNKYFALDYYIDDLEITADIWQDGTASAVSKIEFAITEPNGLTLIKNLTLAIRDLLQIPGGSWPEATYVMVIRFYGYDAQGNLVTDITSSGLNASPDNTNYAIVKYFPFHIKHLSFSMANKVVVYKVEGYPLDFYAKSTALASVGENIELSGETVAEILNGRTVTPATNFDDGRTTTSSPTVETGPQNKSVYNADAGAGAYG
jgi:hypothetical protein